ncbi:helix-turn-helix domain-containing protein [Streptomyces sp. MST-110588]|uniref:winged helix-turn-helix transcriptional regulator n=1 Tax=Streptomyces sp. MST-110588 TaxID=2833628 RepID=UPI001F5E2432|nr:helix-turn-helix domain-containing protein [Streptomyces sp. MST-110588]UNO43213.1 helix-turn-helix transcriptional regulator [Streptomyces sp. MST-110588]
MPRRSYDQYCAVARALDAVGDRWTLLIVRELLGGARRYTDLHADLPGVSTDMLASRLKDMERDGLVTRRRLAPPGASFVYELTARGRELRPVLTALARWGSADLGEKRPTDAVRAHWFALPLMERLARYVQERAAGDIADPEGACAVRTVQISLDEGDFHLTLGPEGPSYADGSAGHADVLLRLSADTCVDLAYDRLSFAQGIASGRIEVTRPVGAAVSPGRTDA